MQKSKVLFSVLVMGGAAIAHAGEPIQTTACRMELKQQLEDGSVKTECLDQKEISQTCVSELTAPQKEDDQTSAPCGWSF